MRPDIHVGTELSVGTIVGIRTDHVLVDQNGVKVPYSLDHIRKIWEEEN